MALEDGVGGGLWSGDDVWLVVVHSTAHAADAEGIEKDLNTLLRTRMESARKYFGDWDTHEQMKCDWADADVPADEQVLIAEYTYEDYQGSAFVLFERDGKLWESTGGHCSCYGLEGQWSPEETSWGALAMRKRIAYTPECFAALKDLIARHVQ